MAQARALNSNWPGRTGWQCFGDAALSLQCKATALVVFLTLLVTGAVSGYLLRSSGELARDEHGARVVQVAAMLAKAAAPPMADGDLEALQALADDSANGDPLLYVIFCDADGRQLTVAEDGRTGVLRKVGDGLREHLPVPGRPVFRTGPDDVSVFLDITYPVLGRSTEQPALNEKRSSAPSMLLGYVRAGMVANHWRKTMASKLDLVVGVGLLTTVAAVPFGFLLVRRIVKPLDGLADVMFRFSQGEFDVRSPVRRHDEIGRLSLAFNRMADHQQHTHDRIVRLNAELEKRVAQRTQQLRELASRDPLTGLYNRRYLNETLIRRFSETSRYETDLSCLMIDLDGFKAVNDAFGHQIGDELLVLAANTITSQLRSADVAARFGGDEFVVLLPQTEADRACVLGERILEQFASDAAEQLPHVRASMSMGIASLPSLDIKDPESLIRAADHALYEAKAAGKNRIVTAVSASRPTLL